MTLTELATSGSAMGLTMWALQQAVPIVRKWLADRGQVTKTEAKANATAAETAKVEALADKAEADTTGKLATFAVDQVEKKDAALLREQLALAEERMMRLGLERQREELMGEMGKLRTECQARDAECQARDRACLERDAVQDRELAVQVERIARLEQMGAQLLQRLEAR